MNATLVLPGPAFREDWLAGIAEFQAEGRHGDIDIDSYGQVRPYAYSVPQTTFWVVDGKAWIGRVSIRHWLDDRLLRIGGHIGYEIRPSKRRQGYGREALRLALPEARKLGIERALVTCDDTNIGSRRIIEANGGVFEDSQPYENGVKLRFWVPVPL
jgi:predicted acetyltransferase